MNIALSTIRCWWKAILHRSRTHSEVQEEFQSYLDAYADDLIKRGFSVSAAKRKARVDLGFPEGQNERYREAIGLQLFDEVGADFRFAFRMLRKNLIYSVVTVGSIALGIAATTAMFSVIYGSLIRPFPYADAKRIMNPVVINEEHPDITTWFALTKNQFETFGRASSIQSLLGFSLRAIETTGDDLREDVRACYVTENISSFLGVPALIGRNILPSDASRGSSQSNVVVLSYSYWQRHFGATPQVLGKVLQLDHTNYTIVGVMPRTFAFSETMGRADVYLPWTLLEDTNYQILIPWIKLKNQTSLAEANTQFQAMLNQFRKETPKHFPNKFHVSVQPIMQPYRNQLLHPMVLLLAAVLLLLGLGAANCSILLAARGAARSQEIALRAAIGASRYRIIRQLLTESILIALAGAVLGIAGSPWLAKLPLQLLPDAFPHESSISLNVPILASSVALSIVVGLSFGLIPALRICRANPTRLMTSSRGLLGRADINQRMNILITIQVSIALVLLSTASMAINGFIQTQHVKLGFDPENAIAIGMPLRWTPDVTWQERVERLRQFQKQVASLPGVTSVAIDTNATPPVTGQSMGFEIEGHPNAQDQIAKVNLVSQEYFSALHIPYLYGRHWTEAEDSRGDSVVIVNQSFANLYWPKQTAVGRQIRLPNLKPDAPLVAYSQNSSDWRQVIAVVADSRNDGLNESIAPAIYIPYSASLPPYTQLLVRTANDPLSSLNSIRKAIQSVSPDQQIQSDVRDMKQMLEEQPEVLQQRLFSVMFGVFSALALALSLVGLFSVVYYSAIQRTSEFGIRMAIGASRANIAWMAMRVAAISSICGIIFGLFSTFLLQRLILAWMDIKFMDLSSPVIASLLLIGCSILACLFPALRACSINPNAALRYE